MSFFFCACIAIHSKRTFYTLNLQIYRYTRIKKRRALLTAAYFSHQVLKNECRKEKTD